MADDFYLKSDALVRFDARPTDVLVPAPSGPAPVPGVDPALVGRFFALCDGTRPLLEVADAAGFDDETLERLLSGSFGTTLFSPYAVLELERAVPSSEIVRFVGSPYELERNYWANMAGVRARVGRLLELADRPSEALSELKSLHALAILGEDGDSPYRPASPAAIKGVTPGIFWETPTRVEETPEGTLLTEGPRVNAAFVGGEAYFELLAEERSDPLALGPRTQKDAQGLSWGRVVLARAPGEAIRPWFLPPRPLGDAHFASLFESLARARDGVEGGGKDAAVPHLAAFHWKFALLHPFRAANQSLSMNVVNALLAQALGAGMPHLVLDQLALRFDPDAYGRLFARAVKNWVVPGTALERYRELTAKKQRYFAFLARLRAAADPSAARAIVEGSPEDAQVSLIGD